MARLAWVPGRTLVVPAAAGSARAAVPRRGSAFGLLPAPPPPPGRTHPRARAPDSSRARGCPSEGGPRLHVHGHSRLSKRKRNPAPVFGNPGLHFRSLPPHRGRVAMEKSCACAQKGTSRTKRRMLRASAYRWANDSSGGGVSCGAGRDFLPVSAELPSALSCWLGQDHVAPGAARGRPAGAEPGKGDVARSPRAAAVATPRSGPVSPTAEGCGRPRERWTPFESNTQEARPPESPASQGPSQPTRPRGRGGSADEFRAG